MLRVEADTDLVNGRIEVTCDGNLGLHAPGGVAVTESFPATDSMIHDFDQMAFVLGSLQLGDFYANLLATDYMPSCITDMSGKSAAWRHRQSYDRGTPIYNTPPPPNERWRVVKPSVSTHTAGATIVFYF